MENLDDTPIHSKVQKAIQSGDVKMRPRWVFGLKTFSAVLGFVLLILSLWYIGSLIVFLLSANGLWAAPGFGFRGLVAFLWSVPWVLLVLSLMFLFVVGLLVSHFSFAYGRPLIFTAFGIIVVSVAGTVIVYLTPLHQNLFLQARMHKLPFGENLYQGYGFSRSEKLAAGEVMQIVPEGYVLETPQEEILYVLVAPDTDFSYGRDIDLGDRILVIGVRRKNTIDARAVRELKSQEFLRPRGAYEGKFKMLQLPVK